MRLKTSAKDPIGARRDWGAKVKLVISNTPIILRGRGIKGKVGVWDVRLYYYSPLLREKRFKSEIDKNFTRQAPKLTTNGRHKNTYGVQPCLSCFLSIPLQIQTGTVYYGCGYTQRDADRS